MNLTKTAQTAATKSKLEAIARVLFSERGFEAVSAEELVAKAKVTRGALYHHYNGKEGLFAAVVETVMRELHAELVRETAGHRRSLVRAATRCCHFSQSLLRTERAENTACRRAGGPWLASVAQNGCAVRIGAGPVRLVGCDGTGLLHRQDVDVLAHVLLGAVTEAAMLIARSPNPSRARKAAERTLAALIESCRIR